MNDRTKATLSALLASVVISFGARHGLQLSVDDAVALMALAAVASHFVCAFIEHRWPKSETIQALHAAVDEVAHPSQPPETPAAHP